MSPEPVLVTSETLLRWKLPEPGSDKYSRGRIVVVGGSAQTPGAVRLAGEAALRAGAGKLQLATVASTAAGLGVAVPEARVVPLPEDRDGRLSTAAADSIVDTSTDASAVLVGPGMVDPQAVVALLEAVVPRLETVVVLDALASAYVTENPDGLEHLAGRCVLTVNPNELSRLLGRDEDEVSDDPLPAALDASARTGAVVLCGGSTKHVATPDGDCWTVQGGGPGLGVSGSGDTQAGMVAGLLARGAEPAQAAVWGGFLHAKAGERLALSRGPVGFLARELPGEVPQVLAELAR